MFALCEMWMNTEHRTSEEKKEIKLICLKCLYPIIQTNHFLILIVFIANFKVFSNGTDSDSHFHAFKSNALGWSKKRTNFYVISCTMLNNHNNYRAIYRLYNSIYWFNVYFSRTNDEIAFNQPKEFPFVWWTSKLFSFKNKRIHCVKLCALTAHSPCTHKIMHLIN